MLPDGAEKQLEDWTIFFLNQTEFNRISPVLALESRTDASSGVAAGEGEEGIELLYVLNLVRTKHDPTVRRYACRLFYAEQSEANILKRCGGKGYGDMYPISVHSDLQGVFPHLVLTYLTLQPQSVHNMTRSLSFSWPWTTTSRILRKNVSPGSSMPSTQWTYPTPRP